MNTYIPGCIDCQRNKGSTAKRPGPLHPLPVPDKCFESVAIDFIGPLPMDDGFDTIVTMTDRLGVDIQIVACTAEMSAEEFAGIFFNTWYCKNGCPIEIISDCDKIFVSRFWKALMRLTRIKHELSTSYHPETDGTLEKTNKTLVQCLQYHIEQNQKGWAKALPKVHFDIMNTINTSTQVSPFILKTGRSLHLLPPLVGMEITGGNIEEKKMTWALEVIEEINREVEAAKDCLLATKSSQAHHANKDRDVDPEFKVGDQVMLETKH